MKLNNFVNYLNQLLKASKGFIVFLYKYIFISSASLIRTSCYNIHSIVDDDVHSLFAEHTIFEWTT